jgi:hypothetical protein
MKILNSKLLTLISFSIVIVGCSNTTTTEQLQPCSAKVETVEVKVPVACQIPKVTCDFSGENFEPTQKLLDCLILHKKLLKACTETK